MTITHHQDLHLPPEWAGDMFPHTFAGALRAEHTHAELEFNLVTAGTATYLLGDRRYDLRRRMLVWLFPRQGHVLVNESPDFACWIGVFKPALVTQVCTGPEARVLREPNPAGEFCQRLGEDDGAWLESLLGRVRGAKLDPAQFNAGLGYALLTAWAAHEAATESAPGTDLHPAVERALRLLTQSADNVSMADVARVSGLSESRLRSLFRTQVGLPLTEFRSRERVKRFLRLYGDGQRVNMLDAALEAGFGSYTQFHRVFRAQRGCGPAAYFRAR